MFVSWVNQATKLLWSYPMVAAISNDSMSDYTKMPFSQVINYIIQNLTVG